MNARSRDFKAVILAGGSGERFWPLSTPEHPKQFLNVCRKTFSPLSQMAVNMGFRTLSPQ